MFNLLKNIALAGAGLFGLLVVIALFTPTSPAPTPANASAEQPTPTKPAAKSDAPLPLGSEVKTAHDRSITITSSETLPNISTQYLGSIEPKGGELIAVYFTAKNTGNESGDMTFAQLALVDSQGREYKPIADLEEMVALSDWIKSQGLGEKSDQLFPGATVDTVEVFRVAPDADGLVLRTNGVTAQIQ
jgi:hypothetical protein